MEFPIQKSQEEKYSVTFFQHIRVFEYIVSAAIFLCVLVVVVYCIWTLDRGFEITDEAYYLLLAQHAASVKYYISAQQWITGGIWQITRSLVMFRAAGMLLLVASSTLLALGAIHAFSQTKLSSSNVIDRHVAVIASSIISGLLYSTTINLSPCYNLLASSSACVAAGLVLFSSSNNIKWQRYVLLFLAGIAIGVEFICKPSAGIATFAILIIWMFIFNQSLKAKISAVAVTIVGFVLLVTVLLYTKTTIQGVSSSITHGFELFRMVQFEPITTRLERYFSNFFYYCFESAKSHCILIVAIVIYQINRREVFLGIAFTSLIYTLAASKYWHATADQYLLIMKTIFVLSALILLISRRLWWKDSKAIYLVCMLITLPYSVALGTGNSLFTQVIISIAPWGVLLALLATSDFENRLDKNLVLILFACQFIFISLEIINGGIKKPYHLMKPLIQQSFPVVVESLGIIKVDMETKKFIGDLKNASDTCNIVRGAPFLGLYNVPGVALAMGAVPVLTPWLNNKTQAEFVIENNHNVSADSTVIALKILEDGKYPQLPKQLTMFPTGYRYCGMAIYPYMHQKIQIWQRHSK